MGDLLTRATTSLRDDETLHDSSTAPYEPYKSELRALHALQIMVAEGWISGIVNAPNGNEKEGERYLVSANPDGVFVNTKNCLAVMVDDIWHFSDPKDGLAIYNKANGKPYYYKASDLTWVQGSALLSDLGTAATHDAGDFEPAGSSVAVQAASLQKTQNLLDLDDTSSARANLGLGTAAVSDISAFDPAGSAAAVQSGGLQKSQNLSDVINTSTARINLGLGTAAVRDAADFDPAGASENILSELAAISTTGKVYTDTIAGLLNTEGTGDENRYFLVPGVHSNGFLTLYRNDEDVAVEVTTGLGTTYVSVIGEESGHAMEWRIGTQLAAYIDIQGYFTPWRFKPPSSSIDLGALKTEISARLLSGPVGESLQGSKEEGGYAFPFYCGNQLVLGLPLGSNVWSGKIERAIVAERALMSGMADIANDDYLVRVVESDGYFQIEVETLSSGQVTRLTHDGYNVGPQFAPNNNLLFAHSENGLEWVTKIAALPNGKSYAATSLPSWYFIGDSLTAGSGGTPYPSQFATLTGLGSVNEGVSGQTSSQIIARFDALPTIISVSGDELPGSGNVDVTSISPSILQAGSGWATTKTLRGYFLDSDLLFDLSVDGDGDYTLTRVNAGAPVACPPGAVFHPDVRLQCDRTTVIWAGTNDGWSANDGTALVANIEAFINRMMSLAKHWLVIGPLVSSVDNSTQKSNKIAANALLASTFGTRSINVQSYLTNETWLTERGVSLDVTDLADIAVDVPPTSLRSDQLHLTTVGYGLVAWLVHQRAEQKGWL